MISLWEFLNCCLLLSNGAHIRAIRVIRDSEPKIAANRARDRLVNRTLRRQGWKILRIWEHELVGRNERRLLRRLRHVLAPGVWVL